MKTSIILALVILLFPVSNFSQQVEHAPTVAQCQADQAVWLSKLENEHGLDDVAYLSLTAWVNEMLQCKIVDQSNGTKYSNTASEAVAAQQVRASDFIYRHSLWQKFLAEDAAGQR